MAQTARPDRTEIALALAVGGVSGLISATCVEPVMGLRLAMPGFPSDAFPMSLPLALSAGVVFGLIGAAYLFWRRHHTVIQAAAFFGLSILGMFCAAQVATHAFLQVHGYDQESYVLAYAAGSPVGALIVMGPIAWLARLDKARNRILRAVFWTTLWSIGVAVAMQAAGSDSALALPWSPLLFCGWQALFLLAFVAPPQRPHMPLG